MGACFGPALALQVVAHHPTCLSPNIPVAYVAPTDLEPVEAHACVPLFTALMQQIKVSYCRASTHGTTCMGHSPLPGRPGSGTPAPPPNCRRMQMMHMPAILVRQHALNLDELLHVCASSRPARCPVEPLNLSPGIARWHPRLLRWWSCVGISCTWATGGTCRW